MIRVTITSRLSKTERQRLRRWVARMAEQSYDLYSETWLGPLTGGFGVYPLADGTPDAVLLRAAHEDAHRAMTAIGRTFEYEVA